MQFTHIIFDLDGTLSNPANSIRNSLSYALNKLNIIIDIGEVFNKFIGPPLHQGFSEIIGLNAEKTTHGVKYFREYYASQGIFESTLYSGIYDLLSTLHQQGISLHIATSKLEKYALKLLQYHQIDNFFTQISGADYHSKEAAKQMLIYNVLKHLPVKDKASTVMVGDRSFDVEGARKNNIKSIGVLYGFGNAEELNSAGADFIAENPLALKTLLLNNRS